MEQAQWNCGDKNVFARLRILLASSPLACWIENLNIPTTCPGVMLCDPFIPAHGDQEEERRGEELQSERKESGSKMQPNLGETETECGSAGGGTGYFR